MILYTQGVMKEFYIADAARFENQAITSFFCIATIGSRDRKGGGQYLALTLVDKTGQFEARMWDEFADVVSTCSTGCYVKVQGAGLEVPREVSDYGQQDAVGGFERDRHCGLYTDDRA